MQTWMFKIAPAILKFIGMAHQRLNYGVSILRMESQVKILGHLLIKLEIGSENLKKLIKKKKKIHIQHSVVSQNLTLKIF